MKSNLKDKDDVCYAQPKTLEQRLAIANDFTKRFKYDVPFGIDEMNNAANDAYAAWPDGNATCVCSFWYGDARAVNFVGY